MVMVLVGVIGPDNRGGKGSRESGLTRTQESHLVEYLLPIPCWIMKIKQRLLQTYVGKTTQATNFWVTHQVQLSD